MINSQDDGINTNEDGVSVTSFVGGNVEINAAPIAEGIVAEHRGRIWADCRDRRITFFVELPAAE